VPAGLAAKVTGVTAQPPPADAAPAANATGAAAAAAANATDAAAAGAAPPAADAPAADAPAAEAPAPPPAPAAAPAPPPDAVISDAPICACALQGVSSSDCQKAIAARCAEPAGDVARDACGNVTRAPSDPAAAATLASFLAAECFVGQGMQASPCVCFQVGRPPTGALRAA
jgi:hypothetical protein